VNAPLSSANDWHTSPARSICSGVAKEMNACRFVQSSRAEVAGQIGPPW
jgi:hypothetical protein